MISNIGMTIGRRQHCALSKFLVLYEERLRQDRDFCRSKRLNSGRVELHHEFATMFDYGWGISTVITAGFSVNTLFSRQGSSKKLLVFACVAGKAITLLF